MRRRHAVLFNTLARLGFAAGSAFTLLVACSGPAQLSIDRSYGAQPALPAPSRSVIPTVNVATAVGWPDGALPTPARGLQVNAFATGLDHPRWLYVLPNGDVLVAETRAPPKPTSLAPKALVMKAMMKKAGAAGPSANRISLLRDVDGDGVAEMRSVLLDGLNSPFGMALVGNMLYVANTDAVVAVPYQQGDTRIAFKPTVLAALPAGPVNQHWTKSLLASPDGRRLYVGVGSNSNIAEGGMEQETGRAAIHEIDIASGRSRVFASGLRNPVGMDFEPASGALWAAVNERDLLGNDLVPDYMTSVRDGGFYGWPYSYFGANVDARVTPPRPDLVARALRPDYALGAHTASLGLAFYRGAAMPQFTGGALIGQHGSWNRKPRSGYKVVFVPFAGGRPDGAARDVLTGFLDADGEARGRPVGVAVDGQGMILVADDVGNTIWRVTPARNARPG